MKINIYETIIIILILITLPIWILPTITILWFGTIFGLIGYAIYTLWTKNY